MRSLVGMTLAIGITAVSCPDAQTKDEFQQDFEVAIRSIGSLYAYFDGKATITRGFYSDPNILL